MHVMHAIDAISERIIFILLYLELSRIERNKVQVESVEILKREGVRIQKSEVRRTNIIKGELEIFHVK